MKLLKRIIYSNKERKLKTLLAVLLINLALVITAVASEWNFYGSSRVETFYTKTDNKGTPDHNNFSQSLQSNSRIGAKVKVSEELVGHFEYGTGVNLRHLYGEWNFGGGELLVGQSWSPLNIPLSNQVYDTDENLNSYGNVYAGRQPMVQLTFGGFKIAAVSPDTDSLGIANATTEVTLPKIEASYQYNFNSGHIIAAAGYNSYELHDSSTSIDYDVDSYIFGVGGKVNLGRTYIAGNIYWGQNTGPYNYALAVDDMPVITGTTLIDSDAFGYILVAGLKLDDMFSFEAGYGYAEAELDSSGVQEDDVASYYIQSTITLAPGVFFVPEIGIIDNKSDKNGNEEPEINYYGIKWQINF